MLAPRRGCQNYYSKVYGNVTKRCFLAWNQNRHITYYIFSILIPKSILFCFCAWDNIQFKESIRIFDQNFKVKLAVISFCKVLDSIWTCNLGNKFHQQTELIIDMFKSFRMFGRWTLVMPSILQDIYLCRIRQDHAKWIIEGPYRGSHPKVVLRSFAKFAGKHLCQSLLLNKIADWGFQNFLEHLFIKNVWGGCF